MSGKVKSSMKNKVLYNLGCIVGGGLLAGCPIIEMITSANLAVGRIDWASIGSLILGITLLVDYYGYHADAEQYKNWWKQISGYFFIIVFVVELFTFSQKMSAIFNTALYLGFLLALYIRYNQLKLK